MQCAESLRVQAHFDGELDAPSDAEIERHAEACAECRARLRNLGRTRAMVRRTSAYASAPAALRARIMRSLDQVDAAKGLLLKGERRRGRLRSFCTGAFSGIGGTAFAAGVAFLLMAPPMSNPLLDDLVNAHLRSLIPDHLVDVVSTDQHTVKPWFAGHTDVSPVVADFELQGYRLIGGRADYFDHQRAAAVVYQHGSHVMNVFGWASNQRDLSKDTTRNGYHLAFWKSGNIVYCAVSDTSWEELFALIRLLQDVGAHNSQEGAA